MAASDEAPEPTAAPSVTALTEPEQELVRAVLAGEGANLRRQPVRAGVLRDLILEARPGWVLPPAGLSIERAIIQGCLDLEGCTISKPLLFWRSRFEGGGDRGAIVVRDGRLKRLGIHSCTVEGNIVADRVEIENGLFLGGGKVTGTLLVRGADVDGALGLDGTEIGNGTAAILAAGLRLSGPLIIRRARLAGEIAVPRAHLASGMYCEDASVTFAGVALNAESARIGGDVLLDRARIAGGLRFQNARIEGRLAASELSADHLPDAFDARGLDVSNGLDLQRARLRGSLALDGARLGKAFRAEALEVDGGETAIGADVIEVGGNWEMPRAKLIGQLRCPGAKIAGQLRLTESRIFGSDIAVRGDGADIRGGVFLSRATIVGLVRFPAAEIGNQFRLRGATVKVESGAAILGSGSLFRRDVELNGGFQTVGAVVLDHARIRGTLDLTMSHVMSAAIARAGAPAVMQRDTAPDAADELALSFVDAEVDRLVMPQRADERPRGIVDLTRAEVGSFEDFSDTWPPPPNARSKSADGRDIDHLVLDGFAYAHLGNPGGERPGAQGKASRTTVAKRRLAWLEGQHERDLVDRFKPQAWVELAARLGGQGYTEDARAILIARHRRERRARTMTPAGRWQSRLLDWLALYGHNPWRTVWWMVAVVLLFSCIWAGAARLCSEHECFDESVFVISHRDGYTEGTFRQSYPGFHSLAYSFDLFVPFADFGYETHWRPNLNFGALVELPLSLPGERDPHVLAITVGGILYVLALIESLLGIVLTSLAVTGFTGLLRGREE